MLIEMEKDSTMMATNVRDDVMVRLPLGIQYTSTFRKYRNDHKFSDRQF